MSLRERLPVSRNVLIAGGVVLLHVGALWALQTGLLRRAVEVVVPVELLSALVEPPRAEPPPAPPQPRPVEPVRQPQVRKAPTPPPAPRPAAIADTTPAPAAPVGTTEPQPVLPPVSAPVAAAPAPAPAAPAPAPVAKVEMPSTDADYLHNPAPPYPRTSYKLGEEGTTLVRVLVGPDGRAQEAQVGRSSGYARLDQAAVETARSWRYVPGKRGGVAEAMWVNVPIKWEISK
jgi:protein TonB